MLTHGEPARVTGMIALVAVLAVGATYAGAWSLGLWWDDYVALRPWRAADVAAAFTGPWDQWDVWPVFYRPLSVAWYALSFELFGLHAMPMHVVSLAGIATAAWLTGLFAWRETGEPGAGMAAAALYATHPAVALAQGPWLFLQNHLLCTLVVLAALLSWQTRRAAPRPGRWWPVFALALAGFLVQEDMIVLIPALLVLQYIRAWTVADTPRPNTRLVLFSLGFVIFLAVARWVFLGQLGGPPSPSAAGMAANLLRGPVRTLLVLEIPPAGIQWLGSAGLLVTILAGVWTAFRRARAPETTLLAIGLGLVACFSAPLMFASSWSRFHLVALGAVLALTGALQLCRRLAGPGRAWHVAAWVAVLALLLGAEARSNAIHRSCSEPILWADTQVLKDWPQVPIQVRHWLTAKAGACARGEELRLTSSLELAVWAVNDRTHTLDHASETGGTGTRMAALVTHAAKALTFEIRAVSGSRPMQVTIAGNGSTGAAVAADDTWRPVTVPLRMGWRSRLRQMHRVDITTSGDDAGGLFDVRGLRVVR